MALIVEDGNGLATAESYVAVAAANTYHTNNGNAGWTGSDTLKEQALRRATRYLDGYYRARWKGFKRVYSQALEWPRYDVYDLSGYYVDPASIPAAVATATCEAALRELAVPGSLSPDVATGAQGVLSEAVAAGPVSSAKTYSSETNLRPMLQAIDDLLSALVRSASIVKLVRS